MWFGDASFDRYSRSRLSVIKWNVCLFESCGGFSCRCVFFLFSYLNWLLLLLTYWRWKYLKAKCRDMYWHTHKHTINMLFVLHYIISMSVHKYDTAFCFFFFRCSFVSGLWFDWRERKKTPFAWSVSNVVEYILKSPHNGLICIDIEFIHLPLIMFTISSASLDRSPPGRNGLSHPDSVLVKQWKRKKNAIC